MMRYGSSIPGLGPQPFQAPSAGSGGALAFPIETYESPPIDLTVVQSNIEVVPARPAHFPIARLASWLVLSKTGTQVTPATTNAGNNLVVVPTGNMILQGSLPSNADVNGGGPAFPFFATGNGSPNGFNRLVNAPMLLNVVTPASGTGGFSLVVRAIIVVYWVAVGDA